MYLENRKLYVAFLDPNGRVARKGLWDILSLDYVVDASGWFS